MNKADKQASARRGIVKKTLNVGYLRVSGDAQEEEGGGLDTQRNVILAAATAGGDHIDEWVVDVDTGAKADRPGIIRVRELAADGELAKLYIWKLDRLARDVVFSEQLWRELSGMGTRIKSATEMFDEGVTGTLMRQILAAFAEYERAVIALRTQSGKKNKVQCQGSYGGGQGIYGYRSAGYVTDDAQGNRIRVPGNGELLPIPEQIAGVKLMFDLRANNKTIYEIATAMNDAGYTTKNSNPWTASGVHKALQNESFYRARGVVHDNIAPSPDRIAHEAAIDFEGVNGLMINDVLVHRTVRLCYAEGRPEWAELEDLFILWSKGTRLCEITSEMQRAGFRSDRSAGGDYPYHRASQVLQRQEFYIKYTLLRGWKWLSELIAAAPPYAPSPSKAVGQLCRWKLTPDEDELVWKAIELRTRGDSIGQIAHILTGLADRPIPPATVSRMIRGESRFRDAEAHSYARGQQSLA